MKNYLNMRFTLVIIFCIALLSMDAQLPADLYKGLELRNIGPSRGGRSVASCGVIGDPMTYYMGSTGGGLYKTTDAGVTWKNISDGFFEMGSVGSVEVSTSDANVIYVGMGEHPVRGVMTSHGDGVYKSTDAGKTWTNIGLKNTRHIAEIRIHPSNPDVVYVAAQGAVHGPSDQRGVYRSENGGKTWQKVLYVDTDTGCADLSMDPNNPRILYAGMWDHRRLPWQVISGGPGSGLYKSTDGGDTWDKLEKGLPEAMGKVSIDVSPANGEVVYANIEAEGKKGGVYRSNDAGKTWKQTTSDRITVARAWYYIEIFADPNDENKVYVLNAGVLKSIDGGKTFKTVKNPHGDQHHLWINPDNSDNIILSNDGGACVTFNSGGSWSSQDNQMTIQFYRVITDERVPYYVYGGQQDNSTIATASRTSGNGIGWKDWYPVSGCESAFIAFDPKDPQKVYGGCYQGNISVFDHATKESKDIIEYPTAVLGWEPTQMKHRFNWNAPIVSNPFDRSIIYHGGNTVMKSTDGGESWDDISPDLTRNDVSKHVVGGAPYTIEGAGGEVYNTLSYIEYSEHEDGTMYTGSDCGMVHITRDEGANWTDITPSGLQESLINAIDISPHNPAKAYLAVTRYKFNDMRPMAYKTTNYGKSWQKITTGLPSNVFVRVIREDPKVAGLLYAGTEHGLYVSYDDGRSWKRMQLNLPVCPITDLTFQDNDLVVATSGRSFWILDDLGAIQQSKGKAHTGLKVYSPKDTYMLPHRSYRTGGMGKNPKPGVLIDYYLPKANEDLELVLEIYDSNGVLIRNYSSEKDKTFKKYTGGASPEQKLKKEKGVNRINWDFRKEGLPDVDGVFMLGSYNGVKVAPGDYEIKMKYGDQESSTWVKVKPDPRLKVTEGAYAERTTFHAALESAYVEINESIHDFISVKKQLEVKQDGLKDIEVAKDLIEMGKSIKEKIDTWEGKLIQRDQKTFQDVINFPNRLNAEIANLISRSSGHDPRLTAGMRLRQTDLLGEWSTVKAEMNDIISTDIAAYNAKYKELDLGALIVPE